MDQNLQKIVESVNYVIPLDYISGRISEYDIKKANINILLKNNVISEGHYKYLESLPKYDREVYIGKMIRSNTYIGECIKFGIIEAKKVLFTSNYVNIDEIIRIANDAVYINRLDDLYFTKFDNIEFIKKSEWTNFVKLNKSLLLFININGSSMNIDVKGINNLELHEPLISVLANVILTLERSGIDNAISDLSNFIEDYIDLKLDVSYYRELNSFGNFKIKDKNFYISDTSISVNDIDINYNLNLLRKFMSILYNLYFSKK